jgi:hypothetical protein
MFIRDGQSGPAWNRLSDTVTPVIFHRDFMLPRYIVDLEVAYFSLQKRRKKDSQCGDGT